MRRVLTRTWPKSGRELTACWIMLNPSSADEKKDDPTIRSCIKHSKRLGFSDLVVVNLYPFRTASPRECRQIAEEMDNDSVLRYEEELMTNAEIVAEEAGSAWKVIAAWGQSAWDEEWIHHVIGVIPRLYCLGTTKSGAPKHPLARGRHRILDTQPLILWEPWNA